jgi:hypothetical protein
MNYIYRAVALGESRDIIIIIFKFKLIIKLIYIMIFKHDYLVTKATTRSSRTRLCLIRKAV